MSAVQALAVALAVAGADGRMYRVTVTIRPDR